MSPPVSHCRKAFTLVELLATVVVLGVLASLLLPTLMRSRDSANAAQCLTNLRHIGSAISFYSQENNGAYPFGYIKSSGTRWTKIIFDYSGPSSRFLFCPQEKVKPPADSTATNYAVNPHVMSEKKTDSSVAQTVVSVKRPSQVVLVTDGSVAAGGISSWGFYNQTGWDKASPALAETPVPNEESEDARRISWRHHDCTQAVFADGHAEALPVGTLKYKNLRSDY